MANAWKHPDAAASGCFILFVGVDVLIDPRREAAWQERRHEGMPPYGAWSMERPAFRRVVSDGRKTPQKTDATEQRGVCAGGKKPTARSINRILKLL